MVVLDDVFCGKEPSTPCTPPFLLFEQDSHSWCKIRSVPKARGPVGNVAVIGALDPSDLHMTPDGGAGVCIEPLPPLGCPEVPVARVVVPVASGNPPCGFLG